MASRRSTKNDRQGLRKSLERMQAAHQVCGAPSGVGVVVEFHLTIYQAAHNSVPLHDMRNSFGILRDDVFSPVPGSRFQQFSSSGA